MFALRLGETERMSAPSWMRCLLKVVVVVGVVIDVCCCGGRSSCGGDGGWWCAMACLQGTVAMSRQSIFDASERNQNDVTHRSQR